MNLNVELAWDEYRRNMLWKLLGVKTYDEKVDFVKTNLPRDHGISCMSIITMDLVMDNPDLPWNFSLLSMNPNLTIEVINRFSGKYWNYKAIPSFSKSTIWMESEWSCKCYMGNDMCSS